MEVQRCLVCLRFHPLRFCRTFSKYNYREKLAAVKRHGYCSNCFAATHILPQCVSDSRCLKCGRAHHTQLHPSDNNTNNTTNNNNNNVRNQANNKRNKPQLQVVQRQGRGNSSAGFGSQAVVDLIRQSQNASSGADAQTYVNAAIQCLSQLSQALNVTSAPANNSRRNITANRGVKPIRQINNSTNNTRNNNNNTNSNNNTRNNNNNNNRNRNNKGPKPKANDATTNKNKVNAAKKNEGTKAKPALRQRIPNRLRNKSQLTSKKRII